VEEKKNDLCDRLFEFAEIRNQKSEIRNQKSEIRNQKSENKQQPATSAI